MGIDIMLAEAVDVMEK